ERARHAGAGHRGAPGRPPARRGRQPPGRGGGTTARPRHPQADAAGAQHQPGGHPPVRAARLRPRRTPVRGVPHPRPVRGRHPDGQAPVMDAAALAAYLDRIGMNRPAVLDATALGALHLAYQRTVPFENLSIHLGEPISLDEAGLIAKIVTRRRGGFCYELNGAFALLLEELGAQVQRVAARVYGGEGQLGPLFDHLALVVHLPDGSSPWLADVGFGAHSSYPLRFNGRGAHDDPRGPVVLAATPAQDDPGGRFVLADTPAGDVDVAKDGQPQYRIERRERALADFVPTCWWQQTSPDSHFTWSTICSRLIADGRISLSGRTLIRTSGGARTEQDLGSDDAVLAAYREHFGVVLDRVPAVADKG